MSIRESRTNSDTIIGILYIFMKKKRKFNKKIAQEAARDMDKIRQSGVFDGGKTGAEIIREWRDKRR